MTRREQIARIIDAQAFLNEYPDVYASRQREAADYFVERRKSALAKADQIMAVETARHIDEYHEDLGDVLWWTNPVDEPPYVGSPLSDDWRGRHEWWTPCPKPPQFSKGPTHDQ